MMTKPRANDWQARAIEEWNVTTFHAYLADRNYEEYGTEYVPFGKGPVSRRWSTEKGQLKQAINKYGNEVVLAFIDKCFETHKFNPKFPSLSFGFMWAYKRNELQRAQLELRKKKDREEAIQKETEVDEDWF